MELAFGAWLKRRRRGLDLTQEDLAKRALCSVNSIRKIEAGDLIPSKVLALELARVLAVPVQTHAEFIRFARMPGATAPENSFALAGAPFTPRSPSAAPKFVPPTPLTATLGREQDARVVSGTLRLPAARLVTLTGPPGTGKTRLALEVAAELGQDFEHGAGFVPLAPVSQPALVETAIAQALDLRDAAQTSSGAALRTFLRDKNLLLVLDNFEHLLGAAPLVNDLLTRAPRLKILATSREPLHVYGERELPVTPLALPPLAPLPPWSKLEDYAAVQLFVERAQAVKPDFELSAENAEAIARLCVGLDGLPLAIEMAAARVKWETPEQLLPHLARRLEAFSGRPRDLAARQRTLRGAIDWSFELLDALERRVLRHLGVFRASFKLEAAQAVCGIPLETILDALVEKSLVKRTGELEDAPRYGLLEMIREYALEQLEAAKEAEQARIRHAGYFQRAAHASWHEREFGAQGVPQHLEIRDLENFRSALEWFSENDAAGAVEFASDLGEFWTDAGLVREGRVWFQILLPKIQDSPTLARGRNAAATLTLVHGDLEEAQTLAERANELAERFGLAGEIGQHLLTLGRIAIVRAEYPRAEQSLRAALKQFQSSGLRAQAANAWDSLGVAAKDRGELDRAKEYHLAALELRRGLGAQNAISQSLVNLAILAYWSGDYAGAIRYGNESIAVPSTDGNLRRNAYALDTIGMAQFKQSRLEEAMETLQQSAQLLQPVGDKRGIAMVLNDMGDVARAQKNFAAARGCYGEALQLCLQTGEKRRAAFLLESLAAVLSRSNGDLRAAKLLGSADALRQQIGTPLYDAERTDYDALMQHLRAVLSEAEFENAWAQGKALVLEDAIALALEEKFEK